MVSPPFRGTVGLRTLGTVAEVSTLRVKRLRVLETIWALGFIRGGGIFSSERRSLCTLECKLGAGSDRGDASLPARSASLGHREKASRGYSPPWGYVPTSSLDEGGSILGGRHRTVSL